MRALDSMVTDYSIYSLIPEVSKIDNAEENKKNEKRSPASLRGKVPKVFRSTGRSPRRDRGTRPSKAKAR